MNFAHSADSKQTCVCRPLEPQEIKLLRDMDLGLLRSSLQPLKPVPHLWAAHDASTTSFKGENQ